MRKRNKALIFGSDVGISDVLEFVFTRESIDYNAFFLRYRFSFSDGKCLFSYERRERKNGYGPTTEKDVTAAGSTVLTEEELTALIAALEGGTARKRNDLPVCGDNGPFIYLYLAGGCPEEGLEYEFKSLYAQTVFEEFCASLMKKEGSGERTS